MGNFVSVDGAPVSIEELFNEERVSPIEILRDYCSNLKAWSVEDSGPGKTLVKSIDFTQDFSAFSPNHSFIIVHTFRKGMNKDVFSGRSSSRNIKLSSHSLLQLAASTYQISLHGLENRFGVNDLQNFFYSKSSNIGFRDMLIVPTEEFGYSVYVWHGKSSNFYVQAKATTLGFNIDRKLMMDENEVKKVFCKGTPMSICDYYHNDVPNFISPNAHELKSISSSSMAICMYLFQHCHLFRDLIQTPNSSLAENVGGKNVSQRSLLQLPPSDHHSESTTPKRDHVKDGFHRDSEYLASPAGSPRANSPALDNDVNYE